MAVTSTVFTPVPHAAPACANARLALFAIRRMGAHGLADANAAYAIFCAFREGFRRPLVLMRMLMAELATQAAGTIAIAPCCCPRMTPAEQALLTVLTELETRPDRASLLMADLLGTRRSEGALMAAAAVAAAFADAGRPIG